MATRRALLILVALSALIPAPVAAGAQATEDRRDSVGALDLRRISHSSDGSKITHTVRSHGGWKPRRLRCRTHTTCRGYLWMPITTDQDDDFERHIGVNFTDGRLRAWIQWQTENCTLVYCENYSRGVEVQAWKPAPDVIKVRFPKRLLGRDVDGYGWAASVVFRWYGDELRGCSKRSPAEDFYYCDDQAPDSGYLWSQI